MIRLLSVLFLPFIPLSAQAAPLRLEDNDRVVLLGSTLIEREQKHSHWELALIRRFPGKTFTVRNLGWSGDNVFGHARAGFGAPAAGFRHLKEHVLALKPTVLVLAYGTNEAFEGQAGLEHFSKGLDTLVETVAPTKARLVFLAPLSQEHLGSPWPDPAAYNDNVRRYAQVIESASKKAGGTFVDISTLLRDGAKATPPRPLTDNGIHPTAWGYWRSAFAVEKALDLPTPSWRVAVHTAEGRVIAKSAQVSKVENKGLRFVLTDAFLPATLPPVEGAPKSSFVGDERLLSVSGLAEGQWTLQIDGKAIVTASDRAWERGVRLEHGPQFEQSERLRQLLLIKNELYFHRWRPQNITYLFGFRKHEQGKNAREIPQFDPLIAEKEAEIARLSRPVPHLYTLIPAR